jgi:chlorophyll synthase
LAPSPAVVLELLKPITWFPPMWAFGCGVVSAGVAIGPRWPLVLLGIVLCGPLVCAMSQAVNDWYDRHVDAINEPNRPIPSGRMPGHWGLYIAIIWTALSLVVALALGPWGFVAAIIGVILAWLYSAPPVRLKRNGWWGNAACALCYEGLPWFTGAAVLVGGFPGWPVVICALLYSVGAHGIMTLNDFKSVEGDRRMGIASIPAQFGIEGAARLACLAMAAPQVLVIALLFFWGHPWHGIAIAAALIAQLVLMRRFLRSPRERAPWYNQTGISLYVTGMLVTAFAIQPVLP